MLRLHHLPERYGRARRTLRRVLVAAGWVVAVSAVAFAAVLALLIAHVL
jgi:hypothetical protein